ncbi:Sulfite efflux pump SSU1 [Cladophialophora carrionii]|uniref:Sulfite efflux pump SSU1 n=1 Tax=Cladophialophora carrionii TaxID=86049 RepID=A0A1C1CTI8_9EURO|nr:Sulfite efflux pump SSU1 [Cladophialophora carrionii]
MDPAATHEDAPDGRPTCERHTAAEDLVASFSARNQHGWRRVVLNFTPSWFAATMGTGIASILLHNLPYNGDWLYWLSVIVFCLNIGLFGIFLFISILRYTMFPGLFMAMIRHPVQSLFCGTFPMGLATIVNMVVFVCVAHWGPWAITLAWTLWWIDVAVAVTTCMWLPFVIMHMHQSELSKMTAAWLLPVVATIVAAASGGIVAEVLPDRQHQLWTIVTSYVLWGTGFPLAMVVLVMYFHRLTIHRLPAREVIVSVFLPLGPLGQGSFALMQLGKVCAEVFPQTENFGPDSGRIVYGVSLVVALVIWGYGLVWLFFAVASITRSRFPFNMGWWGFTFPLGVYAVSTCTLAKEIPSEFFKVLGTIFSVAVVLLWMVVGLGTLKGALSGELLYAPCVEQYEKRLGRKDRDRMTNRRLPLRHWPWRRKGDDAGAKAVAEKQEV